VIRSPNAVRPWQHVLEPLSGYLRLAERLGAGEGPQPHVAREEGAEHEPERHERRHPPRVEDPVPELKRQVRKPLRVGADADPDGETGERGAGDHREEAQREDAVPRFAERLHDAEVVLGIERRALGVAFHPGQEREDGEGAERDPPKEDRVLLELQAVRERGAAHGERLVRLLR